MRVFWILVLVFAFGSVGFGVWYAYKAGHDQGLSECHAASLQAERGGNAKALADLQRQYKAQSEAMAGVDQERSVLAKDLALARAQASVAPVGKDCSLGPDAVRALNLARTGGGQ